MTDPSIYTTYGTVQAGRGIYIPRYADEELLKLCQEKRFAYVLTPRQMGKSSLMVRTAQALTEETQGRILSVIVDLQELGTRVSEEQWYLGFLTKLAEQLLLATDVVSWWEEREQYLGRPQRLAAFFEQVVLAEIEESVVIFVDEIDTTIRLDFTDDFFGVIRFLYLSRAQIPVFHRLSFVLIGVATPGELIRDLKRTPFNIGQKVDLTDFTYDEALPFARGFGLSKGNAEQILKWVLKWTGGHPYLTQRLCRVIAERTQDTWLEQDIDQVVASTFLGAMSEQDNNLQFIRNMLVKETSDVSALLTTYREIYEEKHPITDEEQSLVKSHLKLSGVVRRDSSFLKVRNLIYREVFNQQWIRENLPINWAKRLRQAVIAAGIVFLVLPTPFAIQANNARKAEKVARQEAEQQRQIAEQQRQIAERNAQIAQQQTKVAQQNEDEANAQANIANQQRLKAEIARRSEAEQRTIAEQKQQEAEVARQAEAEQRQIAEQQRDLTGQARIEAEQQRVIAQLNLSTARLASGRELEALLLALKANQLVSELNLLDSDSINFANSILDSTAQRELRRNLLGTFLGLSDVNEQNWFEATARVSSNVVFNADESIILAGSADGKVWFWDRSGEKLDALEMLDQEVRSISLSPDGQTLVAGGLSGQLEVWNLNDSHNSFSVTGINSTIANIGFSSDSQLIAVTAENRIFLLDRNRGDIPEELGEMSSSVKSIAISDDKKLIAAVSDHGEVKLWNRTNGEYITLAEQSDSYVWRVSVAFSPNGQLLATSTEYLKFKVWNLKGGDPITIENSDYGYIASLKFSSDNQTITMVNDRAGIVQKDLADNILTQQDALYPASLTVSPVSFPSPSGQLLVSTQDNKVILWVRERMQFGDFDTLRELDAGINSVSFSPDSTLLAAASESGKLRIWDQTGSELATLQAPGFISSISFSQDGQLIAAGISRKYDSGQYIPPQSYEEDVVLWRRIGSEFREELIVSGIDRDVSSVSLSPDGQILAIGTGVVFSDSGGSIYGGGEAALVNLSDDSRIRLGGAGNTSSISFRTDGQRIVTGNTNGEVKLWDLAGHEVQSFKPFSSPIQQTSFSPDGEIIAARAYGTIKLFRESEEVATLSGSYSDFVFTPDSQGLITISGNQINFFDLSSKEIGMLTDGNNSNSTNSDRKISISPDGRMLAIGDSGGKVALLNINDSNFREATCEWLRGYLTNNPSARDEDIQLCNITPHNQESRKIISPWERTATFFAQMLGF